MIEGLREILEIVKGMPELAIWVAAGFMLYKLAIWGSTVGAITVVSKLAINKLHDYKIKPKEDIRKWDIGNYFINSSSKKYFNELLDLITEDGLSNIYESDIRDTINLIKEHRLRQKANK